MNAFLLYTVLLLESLIGTGHLAATRHINHSLLLLIWLSSTACPFIRRDIAIEMTVVSATLVSFSRLKISLDNFSLAMLIVSPCCEVRASICSQFFIPTDWHCNWVSYFLSLLTNDVSKLLRFRMDPFNPLLILIDFFLMGWLLLLQLPS